MWRTFIRFSSSNSIFPSKQFMHRNVRRPSQKERFVQICSEIEIYQDIFKNHHQNQNVLKFDDKMWNILMNMLNWEERYKYLLELVKNENRGKKEEEEENEDIENIPISSRNQQRLENGEMVYARNFHSFLDIYGADFRKKIDDSYGSNILRQKDEIPEFIVDCRFLREYSVSTQAKYIRQMQIVHESNWFSNRPMKIHFANYKPDQQMAEIAKKILLFRYGPKNASNFQPHPFAPNLTTRRISQILKKDELIYITPRATRFLPDFLPKNIKGFAYCLSNESTPSTSGQTAAISEKIEPYRIPFKKYISSDLRPTALQLFQIANVMRDYFGGEHIKNCIQNTIKPRTITRRETSDEDLKIEEFRSAMHHINNCSTQSN